MHEATRILGLLANKRRFSEVKQIPSSKLIMPKPVSPQNPALIQQNAVGFLSDLMTKPQQMAVLGGAIVGSEVNEEYDPMPMIVKREAISNNAKSIQKPTSDVLPTSSVNDELEHKI